VTEIELKLTPLEPGLLDRLAERTRLGPFEVTNPREEQQRNSFFDTPSRALRKAGIGFRRRTAPGQPMATWTLKAEGELFRGIASRPEVELKLDADMPPALALQALRQRAELAVAEQLRDALADGSQPLARPYLELETQRQLRDLTSDTATAELALDRVKMVDHPEYTEEEVEVELKRGDEQALHEARKAIEEHGKVRESEGSKLNRAVDYIERSASSSR
jgi:inorganic triphosphatase YgiF